MTDQATFDFAKGVALKEEGIARATNNRHVAFSRAKEIAIEIANSGDGTCTIDDVAKRLQAEGYVLGNYLGGVFRNKQWEFVCTLKATRSSSHARLINKWRYVGND